MNIYLAGFLFLVAFVLGSWAQEVTRDWPGPNWMDEGDEK